MPENTIRWDKDADNIVTLTLDAPSQRANTMTDDFRDSLSRVLGQLEAEKESVAGVIVTSAKSTFFAGGNLNLLVAVTPADAAEFAENVARTKSYLRRFEKLGKPTVAALNGAALGGGLEIALACNRRIALDNPKSQFGLPEVTLGLLPGAGGVTRVTRMLGVIDGLTKVLLPGTRYAPAEALEIGLVDEIAATPGQMLAQARDWIRANPETAQPWDVKGYRIPGGAPSDPPLAGLLLALSANLRKRLKGAPVPAPHHIMCAAVEGARVDFDSALTVEGQYFVNLATGQTAKNMIRAFWFDQNSINAGGSRPDGYPVRKAEKVAVLGAGMMGAGIAFVSAQAGLDVVLKDVSLEAAQKGKAYSARVLDKAVSRGKTTEAEREQILARIKPTGDYADLAGVDLVVEAVFENAALKREVFQSAEPVVNPDALLGTNTSTLPITGLAGGVGRQADFIGLHFFSPVDKMPLLEIIRGKQTSDAALARALDFAAQISKTPIVVNDSRGFFTSRVIGTFINEALAMLGEGIPPASIDQATTQAGYPVGALQLMDELNMELSVKIRGESKAAAEASGGVWEPHPAEAVIDKMVALGRPGRLRGQGFFDYDDAGRRTGLWPGLAGLFPVQGDPAGIDLHELSERMLVAESLESARCLEEGVLTTAADANIGSIKGIGFPGWTGGVLQYINGFPGGMGAFVARADEFAGKYGPRFQPSPQLRKRAENAESF